MSRAAVEVPRVFQQYSRPWPFAILRGAHPRNRGLATVCLVVRLTLPRVDVSSGSFATERKRLARRTMSPFLLKQPNCCAAAKCGQGPCVDGSALARTFCDVAALVGAAM